jgi:hypothetical protein
MLKTAEHVDKAMKIETEIGEDDVVFYDVRKEPFKIYGLYTPETESDFKINIVDRSMSADVRKHFRKFCF